MLRVTAFAPTGGAHIGKTFSVSEDGKLIKGDVRMPMGDIAHGLALEDIAAFHRWLVANRHMHMCLTYGTMKPGITKALVAPASLSGPALQRWRSEFPQFADLAAVTRSSRDLAYRPGMGILSIDNDPTPRQVAAGEIKTPGDVWRELCAVWPELDGHARVCTESATTHLYIDGKEVVGRKGCRILLPVMMHDGMRPDAGPRPYMDLLNKRLVNLGRYSVFTSTNGTMFLRTCIDMAMFRPTQPDFLGAPKLLSPRLSQHRPDPVFIDGDRAPLDMRSIPGFGEDEARLYQSIVEEETRRNRDEIAEVRGRWHDRRDEVEFDANAGRIDRATLRRRRVAAMDKSVGVLPLSTAIHIDNGGWVTGEQIVAQPHVYANKSCASPTEADYGAVDAKGVGRHKGMIRLRDHDGVKQPMVIDYAHGAMKWYRFVPDNEIDAFALEKAVGTEAPAEAQDGDSAEVYTDSHKGQKPASGLACAITEVSGESEAGKDVFVRNVSDAMKIQPAPPPVVDAPNYPMIPHDQVPKAAVAIVDDSSDGVRCVLGQRLELAVAEAFFAKAEWKGKTIIVRDYDAAHQLKRWIARVQPKAKVMVIPGRTVDPAKLRSRYGAEFLQFWRNGNVAGMDDIICMKRNAVAALHKAGLGPVASHVCRRPGLDGEDGERCEFFSKCGKIARLQAKPDADVVIETAAALAGQANPLLEADGDGGRASAEMLLTDIADRPTSRVLVWSYRYWQQALLSLFLPFAERREEPSYLAAGEGSSEALAAWAGHLHVRPGMSETAALAAVERWKRQTMETGAGREERLPSRLETRWAIEEWIAGHAIIRVEADKVKAIIQVPPRRLEGAQALVLATTRSARDNMVSRISISPAAGHGVTTSASWRALPSKVVQIAPAAGELDVGHWLAKHREPDKKLRGSVRDVLTLVDMVARMRGPGIVLCQRGTLAVQHLAGRQDVQVVLFDEVTAVAFGAGLLRADARWCIVIGRNYPSEGRILEYLTSASPEDWPASVTRLDGLAWYRAQPVYCRRDGTPHAFTGAGYRWAGTDAVTDQAIVSAVAAPVQRVAEWLSDVAGETLMLIVDGFPLAVPGSQDGVPADEVLTLGQAVPPATWLMTELLGMSAAEVSAVLCVSERRVWQERQSVDGPAMLDALEKFL
jgi:hypothetical protein